MNFLQVEAEHSYPIVLGLGLNSRDRYLLDYWLGNAARRLDRQASSLPGHLAQGLNYFPCADFRTVEQLSQWYLPLLVVARPGPQLERKELFHFLTEAGVAALWLLPAYGEPVVFPQIRPLTQKQKVFLIEENEQYRDLFRQIFYFAGYNVQVDFHSAKEILAALENGICPDLLFLNLDHSVINHTELIYFLDSFLSTHPEQRTRLRLLLTKDFSIPGFSFHALEDLFKTHSRRIFSLKEAVFALITAFFTPGVMPGAAKHSLDSVLYGSKVDFFQISLTEVAQAERVLFLWLYEAIGKQAERGILLEQKKADGLDSA